jgi:hypothetical protein
MPKVKLNKYKVILIEEGLGNLSSCYYYTREALEYAADNQVFEGKKCYANHPDAIKAKTLPERDVRDVIGYYEGVHVESGQAGQALLIGTLCMPDDPSLLWAKSLVECSLDTGGKFNDDYVGLSINASGNAAQNSLESFMNESTLPVSTLPKLIKAKAEGVTDIEVCTRLMEAVSCDLVTEAGAGGRILEMLESERKRKQMPKANLDKKSKTFKMKQAEGDDVDPTQDPDHEDSQQDIELIKSLLQQYCGSDEPSEEECQAMHQALENAKEMGMEGKEAEACAGNSMKMAKHVAAKQAKEAEEAEGDDATPTPASPAPKGKKAAAPAPKAAPANADADTDTDDNTQEGKLESRLIRLEADNAKLLTEVNANKLEKHVDKSLRESGLPKAAQKKFRECIGEAKSTKSVDEKLKIFKEAFGVGGGESVIVNPEKSGGGEAGFSFADCVKTEH